MAHAFPRMARCLAPRGRTRGRSGFALSLKLEYCPFPLLAIRSGEGLDPMAASVQPLACEPITALLLSLPNQGAGRSDSRVPNPHAVDRATPQTPLRGLFPTRFRLPVVPSFPSPGLLTIAIGATAQRLRRGTLLARLLTLSCCMPSDNAAATSSSSRRVNTTGS